MNENPNERQKVGLTINHRVLEDAKRTFKADQCKCLSDFTERALDYYIGYINSGRMTDYLSPTIMSSLKAVSDEGLARLSRLLFKLAVEIAVMNNLYAASLDISEEQVDELRNECQAEVRRTNGEFILNDAINWQRG
ncbi:hypothetical protein SAMN05216413_2618 [Ruminococcaceae bacterium KH2T8]|nr:hypothetical protein SAMN05216413_2618 [Ruminococcaceae bacterium KH2T8]